MVLFDLKKARKFAFFCGFGMQHWKPENLNKPEYFHSGYLLNLSQYVQLQHLYYIPSIKKSPILGKMRKSELKKLQS